MHCVSMAFSIKMTRRMTSLALCLLLLWTLAAQASGFFGGGGGGAQSGLGAITGLPLGDGAGNYSAYAGSSCTNAMPTALSASAVLSCSA